MVAGCGPIKGILCPVCDAPVPLESTQRGEYRRLKWKAGLRWDESKGEWCERPRVFANPLTQYANFGSPPAPLSWRQSVTPLDVFACAFILFCMILLLKMII